MKDEVRRWIEETLPSGTDCEAFFAGCDKLYEALSAANKFVNLTRIATREDFDVKHIADSLGIFRGTRIDPEQPLAIADIGCGAGFPSLVLALACPRWRITAIDSVGKKTAFVESAAAELGLCNCRVVNGRSIELNRKKEFQNKFDVVTARAVGASEKLFLEARLFVKSTGRFLFFKTPEQIETELPTLRLRSAGYGVKWASGPVYELPEGAGHRCFLESLPGGKQL